MKPAAPRPDCQSYGWSRPYGGTLTRPIGAVGSRLLFSLNSSRQIWTTDGTTAGTTPLFAQQTDTQLADRICRLPQRAVMLVAQSGGGYTFWRTDGTPGGTVSFASVTGDAEFTGVVTTGLSYCCFAINQFPGWKLWRTDGISANVVAATSSGAALAIATTGGVVYVSDLSSSRIRLWRSDRVQPFASSSDPTT